ncbi:acetolactate synthase 2 catalytic subunit [Aliagarivorans taiwanensis]|uniref:acetolactate synthase 2 catalytic subunit n=1 Tax=Aliagarivorans taiwanensis TaxID=561966 RepID=UPI00041C5150|nr:acetolactate synthase 2 catalytic subunit [Aliagarivorans taiwanensis]
MNGAQIIVEALRQQGVTQVFGYPGGAIMPLYDALYDGGVEHLLCRHEQGAAMAAVGYARASKSAAPGVCIATSGPGATNLVTGLAEAMLDSIPLVAITGQVAQDAIGTDAFQEVDVLGMSLSVTKHSFLVNDPAELKHTIAKAFDIATSGRPGPVLIDVPKNIQLAEILESHPYLASAPDFAIPSQELLDSARQLLLGAHKPMAYIGGGVGMADAVNELREFLAVTGMPSVTTLKGIGAVSSNSPSHLGMLGMHGTKAANLSVQECDLLMVIGARFDDRVTGKLDEFAPHAKVIHLDIDASEFGKRRAPDVSLSSPLKTTLPLLATELAIGPWRKHTAALKQQNAWRYDHPGDAIYAPLLLKQMSDSLNQDSVVTCDVGQHQMWVAQHMEFDAPENHLSSAGLGTMGFGLPAAVGAQFARPDDTVVCVSGDGSFMMNVQELTSIKRAQLPLKMVLLDNNRLGMVRQWQSLFFDGRHSETILDDNPDFVAMAAAFNIPGETIVKKEQVAPALERMLSADGPYLLHVLIDAEENVWPLVPPNAANHNMLEQC